MGMLVRVWEPFTDAVIKVLNQKDTPVVFILWGGYARKKKALVTTPKHAIIESVRVPCRPIVVEAARKRTSSCVPSCHGRR